LIPEYVRALCDEVAWVGNSAENHIPVQTVFFGGGTPSLLPLKDLEHILRTISDHYDLHAGTEITLEANPGTVDLEYLKGLINLGINRLSLGVQSVNVDELRLLERVHTVQEIIQAVVWSRKAGFNNLNLDLIFGLPAQALATWQKTLDFVLGVNPEHISLYALTLEHGTPMHNWVERGLMAEPDPDLAADMYEQAGELLKKVGYQQYEISNWAKVNRAGDWLTCRHNLQYWQGKPYIGFGAGAHGYTQHIRTGNIRNPVAYIRHMTDQGIVTPGEFPHSPANESITRLSSTDEIGEYMMMGLRLTQSGVSNNQFTERFGKTLMDAFGKQIIQLERKGLLEWINGESIAIRLTKRGRLLGNQVFVEFI